MVLKNVSIALTCAALLAGGSVAAADQYHPGQFLGLDLSRAVLSPKPLGPPTTFAPVPVEAKADQKAERPGESKQARAQPKAEPRVVVHTTHLAHARTEPRRHGARARLAHRHSNPLDAEALDTRIQVWPCRSGGICNWTR